MIRAGPFDDKLARWIETMDRNLLISAGYDATEVRVDGYVGLCTYVLFLAWIELR